MAGDETRRSQQADEPPGGGGSDDEMERQLHDHAVLASNAFVRRFQRKTGDTIAGNRLMLDLHRRWRERRRVTYPTALTAPFLDAWQNIERVQTSEMPIAPASGRARRLVKFDVRTPSASVVLARETVMLPCVAPLPPSVMWTALTKNFDVEDQLALQSRPYFSDCTEDGVVSEYQLLHRLKGASWYEVDFTRQRCEHVLRHLMETWELSVPDLKVVAQSIHVEPKAVIEIHKQMKNAPDAATRKSKKRSKEAEADTDNAAGSEPPSSDSLREKHFKRYEAVTDSTRTLFCRRCCVYDCDYHPLNPQTVPKLELTERNAVHEMAKSRANAPGGMARNCGNQCYLGQTQSSARLSKANLVSATLGWRDSEHAVCARAYLVCAGSYCEMAQLLGDKTCLEVAEFCQFYEINDQSLASQLKAHPLPRKFAKRFKKHKHRPSTAHLAQIESTAYDAIAKKITPCAHHGPCDETTKCSCHEHGWFCSKLCACVHEECKIFYGGCRCQRGRCRTKACPCFASGRECDLDLCTVCCDDLRSELVLKREGDGSASGVDVKSEMSCQNRNVGMRRHKRVRMGRSTVKSAGWGLFVDEFVAKDEFIIEYIGEMVTHTEAEQRGPMYEKLRLSYLFNLDTETVLDSTRKGNKTRFMNHSDKPNCHPKMMNINSDYRIGLYAAHDIEPHSELFFNYGYETISPRAVSLGRRLSVSG